MTIGSTAQTTGITTVNLGNNGATGNTAAQTLTVTGNLTINIGTTGGGLFVSRSTPSHAVNVGGYWTNNRAASFTAGYSTVTFNTAAISRITGTQATTFYNLACVTPNKVIEFAAGDRPTVTNSINLNGQATGTKIVLRTVAYVIRAPGT